MSMGQVLCLPDLLAKALTIGWFPPQTKFYASAATPVG